jgi:hypothetical protein
MTRKHFIAIAAQFKILRDKSEDTDSVNDAARAIAHVCAESNSRFDMERFLHACGM